MDFTRSPASSPCHCRRERNSKTWCAFHSRMFSSTSQGEYMSKVLLFWALAAFALPPLLGATPETRSISIAGEWHLRMDPDDAGIAAGWFKTTSGSSDRIQLPGSTDEQHFANKKNRQNRLT